MTGRLLSSLAVHDAARSSVHVGALDRATLAAIAPPGEADPAQAPAAQHVIAALKPHRPYDYVVPGHSGEPTA